MTKNITIWIFSVLFLLITCVGINDFCHTMTYNEAYIGSHFGAGGLIYFKNYPLALAILFGITVFLPPISVIRLNGQKCCSKVVQSLILSTFAAI